MLPQPYTFLTRVGITDLDRYLLALLGIELTCRPVRVQVLKLPLHVNVQNVDSCIGYAPFVQATLSEEWKGH